MRGGARRRLSTSCACTPRTRGRCRRARRRRRAVCDVPVQRRPAGDHRAPSELDTPPARHRRRDSRWPESRRRDREVRIEAEACGACAVQPDFLLHRGDRDDVELRPAASATRRADSRATYAPSRLSSARRDQAAVRQLDGRAGPHRSVAEADEGLGVRSILRADVEVQVGVLEPQAVARPVPAGPAARDNPGNGPFRVSSSKRWPSSISAEIPPIVVNDSSPFSSMFVTAMPISSMWPTIASVGAPLRRRAPARTRSRACRSVTSANAEAASRQTRAGCFLVP